MKKAQLLKTLLGVSTILVTLSFSSLNENINVNFVDAKLARQERLNNYKQIITEVPSNISYDTEEKGFNYWSKNYRFMGLSEEYNTNEIFTKYKGQGVKVAVIDTGLDIFHEEFLTPDAKGQLINIDNVEQYSVVNKESAYIHSVKDPKTGRSAAQVDVGLRHIFEEPEYDEGWKSYSSHGTAVSSTIKAMINGAGGYGLAPECDLLFIKTDLTTLSCVESIKYAVDHGADIINMSWGGYEESFTDPNGVIVEGEKGEGDVFIAPIKYAWDHGTICVGGAGNNLTSRKSYPNSAPLCIGVGALEYKSGTEPASMFTNFNDPINDNETTNNNVDVMAPGYVIAPNVMQDGTRHLDTLRVPDNHYEQTYGTSFSGPLVCGALALYKSKYPNATPKEMREALLASTIDIGEPGWDATFGFGRVDITRLLNGDHKLESIAIEQGITLTGSSEKPYPTYIPKITFNPSNAGEAFTKGTWSSSNPEIVSIDAKSGMIGALDNGVATITFTTQLGKITASSKVTVTNVTKDSNPYQLDYKRDTGYRIKIDDKIHNLKVKGNGPVIYHTDDETRMTVNEIGNITGHDVGINHLFFSCGDQKGQIMVHTRFASPIVKSMTPLTRTGKDIVVSYMSQDFPYDELLGEISYVNHPYTEIVQPLIIGRPNMDLIGLNYYTIYYSDFGDDNVMCDMSYVVTNKGAKQTTTTVDSFMSNTQLTHNNYFTSKGSFIKAVNMPLSYWMLDYDIEQEVAMRWEDVIGTNDIGTAELHPNTITISSSDFKNIAIDGLQFIGYAPGAKLSITINGEPFIFDEEGNTIATFGQDFSDFFAYGNPSKGEIVITISNITDTVRLYYIGAYGPSQEITNFDLDKQALSYASYVLSIPTCYSDWDEDMINYIPTVIDEFNYMIQGAKNDPILTSELIDNGHTIIEKLKTIVTQYNEHVNPETPLTLILEVNENGDASVTFNGINNEAITSHYLMELIILIPIFVIGVASLIFFKVKAKKEH